MASDVNYAGDVALDQQFPQLELAAILGRDGAYDDESLQMYAFCGDRQVVVREARLQRQRERLSKYKPSPTVCHLFQTGAAPADRCTTRLGGLPYWPRKLPWPRSVDPDYGYRTFSAQLDFRGICWPEPLPGDILTVHFDEGSDGNERFFGDATHCGATLTWHNSQANEELLDAEDVPTDFGPCGMIGPYYGTPIVLTDYKRFDKGVGVYDPNLTIHGTKIGGHSPYFGDNWHTEMANVKDPVFLCSIGSVGSLDLAESSIDFMDPDTMPEFASTLMWMDMGTFVIVYPKGHPEQLHWSQYMS